MDLSHIYKLKLWVYKLKHNRTHQFVHKFPQRRGRGGGSEGRSLKEMHKNAQQMFTEPCAVRSL